MLCCALQPSRLWNLPDKVTIYEVGPRDGLQNEKELIPTDTKVALVDHLTDAGFSMIETTSFVSPKWVPQLADAGNVMKKVFKKPGTRYPVLIPNTKVWGLLWMRHENTVFIAASNVMYYWPLKIVKTSDTFDVLL